MFRIKFPNTKACHLYVLIAMLFAMLMGSSSAFAATTTIVSKYSGKCLDVRGGANATGNGAPIEQWTCAGPTATNQIWTLKDMGGAQYEFIASISNKCVDIYNSGTANGTAIQQMDCTGRPNQLWKLNSLGSGQYQIISTSSGRCLDVTGGQRATGDGALTELWDCVPQAGNQSWALTVPTANVTTQVISVHSGKCLDVTGGGAGTGNGVPIEQWACAGPAATNQAWTVKDMGNGQYEFIASNSGKCLDITNSSTVSGTPIQQMDCTGQPNQLWKLLGTGVRQFQLISAMLPAQGNQNCLTIKKDNSGNQATNDGASIVSSSCDYEGSADNSWTMDVAIPIKYLSNNNECMDVRGGEQATADGTPVEIWACTGLKNQLWTAKDKGNNRYQFVASNSGKCLDLVSGTGEGVKARIAQCADTPTQLWSSDNEGLGHRTLISVAPSGDWYCLDIIGGYSAAADGVLTQVTKCTGQQYSWVIGTSAPFP
jgi:hypothetical protein